MPPELVDEPEDGTDTGTEAMGRLEATYGNARTFLHASRIGVNSPATVRYAQPHALAHVAECIGHVPREDIDIGVRCGMDYDTHVNLGIGYL